METARPNGGPSAQPCEFCQIIARRIPARFRYEDDDFIVFHNRLTWAPVMLLVVPRRHVPQESFWLSPLFPRAAELAMELGHQDCPKGFRVLSNFGEDALQTQDHGHLHVVGGRALGLYMDPRGSSRS